MPLSIEVLPWVMDQIASEALSVAVDAPSRGWVSRPASAPDLARLVEAARSAGIVQRPGPVGLLSRVVLLDADGQPLAWIGACAGEGEPVSWRVILLMALIASEPGVDL